MRKQTFWMIAFAALLFFALAPAVRADSVKITPTFTHPGFGFGQDPTIENKLITLIRQAQPHSSIRVAEYVMDRTAVAKALVLASENDVDVQLVLDGRNQKSIQPGSAVDILLHGFDGHAGIQSCSDEPCVKFCHGVLRVVNAVSKFGGSCHGVGINHNKFFLFSKLSGGRHDVIVQTSFNIDQAQIRKYNDLLEIDNDPKLFVGFMKYWRGLRRDTFGLLAPHSFGDGKEIEVYTFPRLVGKDPVAALLKRVSCERPGSVIRASQSDFGRVKVAKQFARLRSEGCDVRVLAVDDRQLGEPGDKVKKIMGSSMALIEDRYKGSKNSIHTKMLLIDASLDGSKDRQKIVLTGSHNLDFFSERLNDETLLEIHNDDVYAQYLKYWKQMVGDAYTARLTVMSVR